MYDVVAGLYDDIWKIRDWLNQLQCTSAFNSRALPQGYILDVQGEEAGSIEFGLFTLAGSSNAYFMVVNRVCSKDDQGREADPQVINLQTSRSGGNGYQIRDLRTEEIYVSTDGWFRNISIAAGEGRLFELRPIFTGNEVWADTVNVSSTITVPSGKILTIDPGVALYFAAGTKLTINGLLLAEGTSSDKITFTSVKSPPARSDWQGLYFSSSGRDDRLSYCDIKYAKWGIECASSSPTIDHCTVRICERGLYLRSSSTPTVSNSYFCKNLHGAYVYACYSTPGGDENFYVCYFDSNSYSGAYLINSKPWIALCTFRDNLSGTNGYGIFCQSSAHFRLSESTLLRNKMDGLRASSSANPLLYYDSITYLGGYNSIADNLRYGVSAQLTSYPNLGTTSTYPGNNSIYNNSSFEVRNENTSGAINGILNYWGSGSHPVLGDFFGTVNYIPFLSGSPQRGLASGGDDGQLTFSDELAYLCWLGAVQMAESKYDEAFLTFQKIIEGYAGSGEAKYALSEAVYCLELGKKDAQVLPFLDDIAAKYKEGELDAFACLEKVYFLNRGQRHDESLKEIEFLLSAGYSKEVSALALFEKAMLYEHGLIDLKLAQESFEQFVSLYPQHELAEIAQLELACMKGESLSKGLFYTKESPEQIPASLVLYPNHPNPFNPETRISFALPKEMRITLRIYNLFGEEVARLYDGNMTAGTHSLVWDGRNHSGRPVTSGLYLYQLESEQTTLSGKMILMR